MIKLKDILNEAPEHEMAASLTKVEKLMLKVSLTKVDELALKIIKRYKKKADVEGMVRSWMMGLHAKLKKMGIKI